MSSQYQIYNIIYRIKLKYLAANLFITLPEFKMFIQIVHIYFM